MGINVSQHFWPVRNWKVSLLFADERTAFECIQRLEKFPDCMSIVRVADANPALIGRALDAGASAIIAPMINNAQDAKKLIEQCR